jgi:hypothetical protein
MDQAEFAVESLPQAPTIAPFPHLVKSSTSSVICTPPARRTRFLSSGVEISFINRFLGLSMSNCSKQFIIKPGSKVDLRDIDPDYHGKYEAHEAAIQ